MRQSYHPRPDTPKLIVALLVERGVAPNAGLPPIRSAERAAVLLGGGRRTCLAYRVVSSGCMKGVLLGSRDDLISADDHFQVAGYVGAVPLCSPARIACAPSIPGGQGPGIVAGCGVSGG